MNRNSSDDKVEFINELNELSSQVDLMDYVFVLCSLIETNKFKLIKLIINLFKV